MAGLYIHIPFCARKCAYCDFPSFVGREQEAGRYFDAVVKETELWQEKIPPIACGHPPFDKGGKSLRDQSSVIFPTELQKNGDWGEASKSKLAPSPSPMGEGVGGEGFVTVFIGGGTPSLLPAGQLAGLMERLGRILALDPVEFTVEANPGTVDQSKLDSFRRMGANRLSFGVQAAQDHLLQRIGRIHSWEDFVRSVSLARQAGFANVSADMMTGLPGQTEADAAGTARRLVDLGLDHVSCYGLIVEEGTPLARAVQSGEVSLPDDDGERAMFHAARVVLEDAGIKRYEISNFARPGHECRHNLNYWLGGDWLGLGLGAASHFNGRRRENGTDLEAYMAALEAGTMPPAEEHVIGAEEAVFETVMLELRLVEGIDFARFTARHGFDFLSKYGKQVDGFIQSGLMQRTYARVALTTRGMDLQNAVLMEFME